MPASPWRTFGSPEPDREYVALLSCLPLKSYWRIPVFFFYTAQVTKQLASADGVPVLEAVLDAVRLEGQRGAANFRSVPAARAYNECPRSAHGRNEVRALDG
jgi:hypothetical protein